jgi:SAM-dependent methyltransferase
MDRLLYEETFRAESEHWWFIALHELVEGVLEDFVRKNESRSLRLFDAGCGTGGLMSRLSKFGEIEGMDFSEDAIQYCRERKLARASLGDLNEWSCEPDRYDVITSLDVFYHRAIRDDAAILERFHEGLRKGGILVLNLPAFDGLSRAHDIAVRTARRYRLEPLAKTLQKAGFEIRIRTYRLSYLFFPAWIKAWQERRKLSKSHSMRSDLHSIPSEPWNHLLLNVNRLENRLIRKGVRMPFGVSAFVVAQKPGKS